MFVDRVAVFARGGAGGAGIASFVRRKGMPRGKPDGGNGGPGGNVEIRADASISTLLEYSRRPHRRAGDGKHGEGALRHGKAGEDLIFGVPAGTVVLEPNGIVLADLVSEGQSVVVARGGRGGLGNAGLVSRNLKAPGFAEQGEYGEEREVILELKLMADAALIGFPNAGKSTIVAAVSASRPKIADYPFTTLVPNLGVVDVGDRPFVLADVPGLIEGAAEGKGLGHEFLRHTERARVLIYVLDPSSLQTESVERQYEILQKELADHDRRLADRPSVVVINKSDLENASDDGEEVPGARLVSGVTGAGLDDLMSEIARMLSEIPVVRSEDTDGGYMLHRPVSSDLLITETSEGWVVAGRAAERAVAFSDLTIPIAADLAAARLRNAGVDDALKAAGAEPGDEVRIGDIVFEFQPEEEE
jgi:GTP-binding protein